MARASGATAKQQPDPVPAPPVKTKTAVVVIHGIGEQTPLETLQGFVETVYRRDRSLASRTVGSSGMLDVSIVPDDVTGSAELRRITTLNDGPQKRTDFFEFYWADIMDGTPVDMVTGWIRTLVLRSPWRLPAAAKVRWAWLILATIFAVFTAAGLLSVGHGVTQMTDGRAPGRAEVATLSSIRAWVAGLVVACGLLWFVVDCIRARFQMARVALVWPMRIIVAGAALGAIPSTLLGSLAFWASAAAILSGWALHAIITPFAGDVVRYIRAKPSTVERRRLVRERGLGLLEALHKKRLDGSSLETFTQAETENPPLYDRIVLVGHSLGTIIAYDILQLFWEKYGPTHHQDWNPEDDGVQDALKACDAYVKDFSARPGDRFDAEGFAKAQAALYAVLNKQKLGWRISDFITLGSPLAHAEFLLVDSAEAMKQAAEERRFATAPPHPDPLRDGSMLFSRSGMPFLDGDKTKPDPLFPHFAAQFAAVKWTNLFDESPNPLLGDLISGSLAKDFGPGIEEHQVSITRPSRWGVLKRVFTHTQYWTWHESYAPSPENVRLGSDRGLGEARRRELLWHNVPDHIRLLRLALRLGP